MRREGKRDGGREKRIEVSEGRRGEEEGED